MGIMKRILFISMMLFVTMASCTPIYEGAMRYDGIFFYDDGKLTNAHGYEFKCNSDENLITFQVLSYGIDAVEVSQGAEFVSIVSQPMVPPSTDDILENVIMPSETIPSRLDKYLQEITLKVEANAKSKRRKSVIRMVSLEFNGFEAKVTIRQDGK